MEGELELKKRQFYDSTIEIIRLIEINQIQEANKLYSLCQALYSDLLPSLNQQEVSQYYNQLTQIYNRLAYFSSQQGSGETMHKTDIDILYETVQKKGSMTIKEVQTQFKIDKKKADEWATILEENGLIKIRYSMFKGMILKKVE